MHEYTVHTPCAEYTGVSAWSADAAIDYVFRITLGRVPRWQISAVRTK